MNNVGQDNFYLAFENRFRGSREDILARLKVYSPFLQAFAECTGAMKALDLGCGRGEWLQLLQSEGFQASGVDLDNGMLEVCYELGLQVSCADAIEVLQSTPSQSLAIVSGFHIAEHLPFESLRELIQESHRVLQPGGILILETPNPESFKVLSYTFLLDHTHNKPLPPDLLMFMTEYCGFKRSKVLRLQEKVEKLGQEELTIEDIFYAVSPDYAVIAQKDAGGETLSRFDSAYDAEYGLRPELVYARYQTLIDQMAADISRLDAVMKKSSHILEAIKLDINKLITAFSKLGYRLSKRSDDLFQAGSGRMTATCCCVEKKLQWFYQGTKAWLTLKSGARPRKALEAIFQRILSGVASRPAWIFHAKSIARLLPKSWYDRLQLAYSMRRSHYSAMSKPSRPQPLLILPALTQLPSAESNASINESAIARVRLKMKQPS